MTQEEKQLLIKDLCARIPNHVKVELHGEICTCLGYFDDFVMLTSNTPLGQQTNIDNIKPYLRPMSSMTNEELKEILSIDYAQIYTGNCWSWNFANHKQIDWLNEHHFDYRGLIERGLAIAVTEENNPYKE